MASIAEIKFDIINTVRPRYNGDDLISEDHVEYLIRIQRALWISNKVREFGNIPNELRQTLNCIPLIDASVAECCDIDYADGCTIKRTQYKIPNFVNLVGGAAVLRVSSIFMNEKINIQYVKRNRSPYVGLNRWNKNLLYGFIKDDYMYLVDGKCNINGGLKMITIEGIFSDPLKAANLIDCDGKPCYDPLNDDYPMVEKWIPFMKEQIINQLVGEIQMPVDKTNDSSHEALQRQQQ